MRRFAPRPPSGLVLAELGGADSCFYEQLVRGLRPRAYHAIDKFEPGLDRLWQRREPGLETVLHHHDILLSLPRLAADVVFSVGLIEHVASKDLARAVRAHFDLVSPQGVVIMSFPTPTWLYNASRFVAESMRLWKFHDEKPLTMAQVVPLLEGIGEATHISIIWPIFFTQAVLVARPRGAAATALNDDSREGNH
jgi:hypothetical protein